MKKLIFALASTLAFTPAALAGHNVSPQPQAAPQSAYNQNYGAAQYAPQFAAQGAYEDEVVVYEERARKKQSYYFKPRDARSLKCKTKQGTQKCTFSFHGDNADDVEFYLAQALIFATGNTSNQAQCYHTRRTEKVSCSVRGDLSRMDTGKLRYALYGR